MADVAANWGWLPIAIVAGLAVLGAIAGLIAGVFKLGRWVEAVNTDRTTFQGFINEVRADIKQILLRLPSPVEEGGSPRQLTDLGKKVAAALDAERWAAEVADKTLSLYGGLEDFEIDQKARDYADRSLTPEVQRTVAKIAYEFGLDQASVRSVLGIMLREAILKRR